MTSQREQEAGTLRGEASLQSSCSVPGGSALWVLREMVVGWITESKPALFFARNSSKPTDKGGMKRKVQANISHGNQIKPKQEWRCFYQR